VGPQPSARRALAPEGALSRKPERAQVQAWRELAALGPKQVQTVPAGDWRPAPEVDLPQVRARGLSQAGATDWRESRGPGWPQVLELDWPQAEEFELAPAGWPTQSLTREARPARLLTLAGWPRLGQQARPAFEPPAEQ
jgi:hypothetical protein